MFSWFCGGGREEGRWSFCSKNFPQSAVDRVRAGGERGAAGSEQEALRRGRSLSLNGPGGPRAPRRRPLAEVLGRRPQELWRGCTFPCPAKVDLGKAGGCRWPRKEHLTTKGKKAKRSRGMQIQENKYYFRGHQVRVHHNAGSRCHFYRLREKKKKKFSVSDFQSAFV